MKIVVTGGAGFIGSSIVDRLILNGEEVLVLDNLSTGRIEYLNQYAEFENVDIDSSNLKNIFLKFQPEAIIHCAAQISVKDSESDPIFDAKNNIISGLNLLKIAIDSNVRQILYLGTGGALYGEPKYLPCDEIHPINPISPYGLSKWTLERYMDLILPEPILKKVLRLGNVYGPRQDHTGASGVVAIFLSKMFLNNVVEIYGDGEQVRDFIFISDVVDAVEIALKSTSSFTVNISSGVGASVNEIFKILCTQTLYKDSPQFKSKISGDINRIILSNDKAKSYLDWAPKISLEEGLNKTSEWFKNNFSK
ncbi:MAG: NAD-dependent epimerase/dehydratase family protein [SAR202 cluster bacterium]|nr:NAD-dependent epimerase/dehydratase family protein [SAR202 cluster bacterium]|tara:strand:+ start:25839 stop:26762 length:924 start_codon:yes stop_codon:yes gene_type:complete